MHYNDYFRPSENCLISEKNKANNINHLLALISIFYFDRKINSKFEIIKYSSTNLFQFIMHLNHQRRFVFESDLFYLS